MRRIWSVVGLLVMAALVACVADDEQGTKSLKTEKADPATAAAEQPKKPKREPIYLEEANGEELIAAALQRARRDHKHVLIEWGGNWCGWCHLLHDVFTKDENVRPIVFEEYELVLIDSGPNQDLMQQYGGKDRQFSYPHLTLLDAEGNVLVNQNTEPLEEGPKHNPQVVAEFLKKWAPERRDAEILVTEALAQAAAENKRVLVHVGTPYCGWCKVLSQFLMDHGEQFQVDYVELSIDTLRMDHGESVAERFRPGASLGVPWMVILDANGKVLADSVGPDGNCGYPYTPGEVEHFLSMLKSTAQRMAEADFAQIRQGLETFREEREQRQRERAEAEALDAKSDE